MSKVSKNSLIWEHILNQYEYNNDMFIITARQIKECKNTWKGGTCQFEPRLLCYQSSDEDRPDIFKKKNIYILPIKNGEYLLSKNNTYKTLEYKQVSIMKIEKDKSSMLLDIGDSETSLIDNLRYSGIFETDDFLGEKITHGPLLNGRHYCTFKMKLGLLNIKIEGVQYEIDSCFESDSKVLLIEGKSGKDVASFNIRQLYYPFRVIYDKIKNKEIICIFIHKSNEIVNIWKYIFTEFDKMDSIKCIGYYKFSF